MFPVGIKTKCFNDKINISAQLQCAIDKEINSFYHRVPLKKEPFEVIEKDKPKNITKKIKNKIKN
jgi:hypothetical protein